MAILKAQRGKAEAERLAQRRANAAPEPEPEREIVTPEARERILKEVGMTRGALDKVQGKVE